MFALSALEAAAWGLSGFIMAMIISSLSKNREIPATLFGSLIVVIFYVFLYFYFNPYNMAKIWKYTLIDIVLSVAFLFAFAFLGAWLIARRRHLKVQSKPQNK